MKNISYSDFRKNLASVLDQVQEDHAPVMITRKNGTAAVVLSLDDFHAYEETVYLLSSPANAARLKDSVAQAEQGAVMHRQMIDE